MHQKIMQDETTEDVVVADAEEATEATTEETTEETAPAAKEATEEVAA